MHNLDTCEVTVVGEELSQEQESLEVDVVRLQQKGMEMSSSNLGMIITGEQSEAFKAGSCLQPGMTPVWTDSSQFSPLPISVSAAFLYLVLEMLSREKMEAGQQISVLHHLP